MGKGQLRKHKQGLLLQAGLEWQRWPWWSWENPSGFWLNSLSLITKVKLSEAVDGVLAGPEVIAIWWPLGQGSQPRLRHFLAIYREGWPKPLSSPFWYAEKSGGSEDRGTLPTQPSPPHSLRFRGTWQVGGRQENRVSTTNLPGFQKGAAPVSDSWKVAWRDGISLVGLACLGSGWETEQTIVSGIEDCGLDKAWQQFAEGQGPDGSKGACWAVPWWSSRCGTHLTPLSHSLPSWASTAIIGSRPWGFRSPF